MPSSVTVAVTLPFSQVAKIEAIVTRQKKATVANKAGAVTKKIGATAKKKKISRVPPNLEIDPEVLDFIEAIDKYKKKHNRPFPSWSEVLYVFRKLGYKKS